LVHELIPLEDIAESRYARVLTYPVLSAEILGSRVEQMMALGVLGLRPSGRLLVDGLEVLGKGCVGLVVEAQTTAGWAALKLRRVDANRQDMEREAKMLELANSVGVGPKLIGYAKDFLLMELIEGVPFSRWLKSSCDWETLEGLLRDCQKLDILGLDHGELSRASKNVLVTHDRRAEIIDFESASNTRKVRNVSSIVNFILRCTGMAITDGVLRAVRHYKNSRQEGFSDLLECLKSNMRSMPAPSGPAGGQPPMVETGGPVV